MKRLPVTLAGLGVICALALVTSACNAGFSPYAASVNGTVISQAKLRSALSAINDNASYRCAIESSGTTTIAGVGQGTYNAAFSAQVLSILIQDVVARRYVEKMRISEPAALQPIALSQLETATTPPSTCPGSGASLMAAFVPSYRNQLIQFQEDEDALALAEAGTTFSGLGRYVAKHPGFMSVACVSVIVVPTEAKAASIRVQLLHGAKFAALAKKDSTDTTASSGGVVGCVPDTEFTAPLDVVLAGLATGAVSSPVSFGNSSSGTEWLLLEVTKRQAEAGSQAVSSLLSLEQTALNRLLPSLLKQARVQVDPQFGSWKDAKVEAPAAPPSRFVPNPGADSGSGG